MTPTQTRGPNWSNRMRILFTLFFFSLLLSPFLPWWSFSEYKGGGAAVSTQSVQILPPIFRIDSVRNVVLRELNLEDGFALASIAAVACVIISLGLGIIGFILLERGSLLGLWRFFEYSALISILGCALFVKLMGYALKNPPYSMGLFGGDDTGFYASGYSTAWGLSNGFYLALIAAVFILVSSFLFKKFYYIEWKISKSL